MSVNMSVRAQSIVSSTDVRHGSDGNNHKCVFSVFMLFLDKIVGPLDAEVYRKPCAAFGTSCIPFPEELKQTADIVIEAIHLAHACGRSEIIGGYRQEQIKSSAEKSFIALIEALGQYNVCEGTFFQDDRSEQALIGWESEEAQQFARDHREARHEYETASARQMKTFEITSKFSTMRAVALLRATQSQQSAVNETSITQAQPQNRREIFVTPTKRSIESTAQTPGSKRLQTSTPYGRPTAILRQPPVASSQTPPSIRSNRPVPSTPAHYNRDEHNFNNRDLKTYKNQLRGGQLYCFCEPPTLAVYDITRTGPNKGKAYCTCPIPRDFDAPAHERADCGFYFFTDRLDAIERHILTEEGGQDQDVRSQRSVTVVGDLLAGRF